MKKILLFLNDEQGATAVEYALMISLIAFVIILAVTALGLATFNLFDSAADEFENF
jgi:pilus assembly protein Flp/PilA